MMAIVSLFIGFVIGPIVTVAIGSWIDSDAIKRGMSPWFAYSSVPVPTSVFVWSVILFVILFGIGYMLVTIWLPWQEAKEEERKRSAELEERRKAEEEKRKKLAELKARRKEAEEEERRKAERERSAELEERRKAEEEERKKAEKERLTELEAGKKAEEEEREKEERERLAELEARRKAKEEERKNLAELKEELEELQKNIPNIFLDDIKVQLSKGDFERAEQLLGERKQDYERYLEFGRSLKDVEEQTTMLSTRLAKGELTSDAYERAVDALERKKHDIDEELWKIQRKIFREKYEKPF